MKQYPSIVPIVLCMKSSHSNTPREKRVWEISIKSELANPIIVALFIDFIPTDFSIIPSGTNKTIFPAFSKKNLLFPFKISP